MNEEEESIKYLYSITDESLVKEIEDTTLSYYKELFESTELIKSYLSEIETIENNLAKGDINRLDADDFRNQINSINTQVKENRLKLNNTFWSLFDFSIKNNFFFCYSNLDTYKFYYDVFFKNYKRISHDADIISFLKYEYEYHYAFERRDFLIDSSNRTNFVHRTRFNDHFSYLEFYPNLFERNKLKIKLENEKILKFIKEEINKQGFQIVKKSGNDEIELLDFDLKSQSLENFYPEPEINKKGLPKVNVQTRYHLFKSLGYEDAIIKLKCENPIAKSKLLAILLNISIDNARHLLNGTYKHIYSNKDEEKIKKYLSEQGIDKQFLIE